MEMESNSGTPDAIFKPRRWWLALLLAACSNVGYLYVGRPWRLVAVTVFVLAAFALVFFGPAKWLSLPPVYIGLILLIGLVYLLMIADATRLAVGQPHYRLRWYNRWWAYLAVFILLSPMSALPEILGGAENAAVRLFSIPSKSGQPTLRPGDYVTADTTAYRHADPARGDIVIYKVPGRTNVDYIFRIIGLPGDTVQIKDGKVFINDRQVDREETGTFPTDAGRATVYRESLPNGRSYDTLDMLAASMADDTSAYAVPHGYYFVLGDHRDNAFDSRFSKHSYVARSAIHAKAIGIVYAEQWSRIGLRLDK